MIQAISVIIIISLAVITAAVKLYRYFNQSRGQTRCTPDACATCPYNHKDTCDEKKS